jgi:hypothetical protein
VVIDELDLAAPRPAVGHTTSGRDPGDELLVERGAPIAK